MSAPDLTYLTTGLYTRFMPNTPAGVTPWDEMNNEPIYTMHLQNVLVQLRTAGYTVHKARRSSPRFTKADDALLALLNA